jgi:hypothetical protein
MVNLFFYAKPEFNVRWLKHNKTMDNCIELFMRSDRLYMLSILLTERLQ